MDPGAATDRIQPLVVGGEVAERLEAAAYGIRHEAGIAAKMRKRAYGSESPPARRAYGSESRRQEVIFVPFCGE